MLRLSGNYQIIVMYNISMTIKGISICVCVCVQQEQVIVFRCVFLCATQATLNLGSVGVIIHGRNCTANAIPTLSLSISLWAAQRDCLLILNSPWPRLSIHCIIVISHPLSPALSTPSPCTGGCLLSPLIVDLAFFGQFFFVCCSTVLAFLCRFLRVVVNYH